MNPNRIREGTDPDLFLRVYNEITVPSEGRRGKVAILDQMIRSPRRRLIPEYVWEDLVWTAVYEACTNWDPNRAVKCPIRNYVWRCLEWKSLSWWNANKHGILNTTNIDDLDPSSI
jgi:hypothetical protein